MRHMVNGRIVEVATDRNGLVDSDAIRRAADIPGDRQLVLQSPSGENRIVNPGESISLGNEEFFTDAPLHRRG